jgi:hypothetical protein
VTTATTDTRDIVQAAREFGERLGHPLDDLSDSTVLHGLDRLLLAVRRTRTAGVAPSAVSSGTAVGASG